MYSRSPPGLSLSRASRPGLRTFTRSSNVFTSEPEPGPTRGTRFRVLSCCERARCRRRRGRLIDLVEGETPTSRQSKRVPCRFAATRMFRFVPVGRFRKISARNYSSHQEMHSCISVRCLKLSRPQINIKLSYNERIMSDVILSSISIMKYISLGI